MNKGFVVLNRALMIASFTIQNRIQDARTAKVQSFGMVRVGTADVVGKYTNELGASLAIFVAEGKRPVYFSIQAGAPKGATVYELSEWELKVPYTSEDGKIYPVGHRSYKATAVVLEEDAE